MANNYYDATGVLVLARVTPVITALFGGFKLGQPDPNSGETFIAQVAESNHPHWDDILENLVELASNLGLSLPAGSNGLIEDYLRALASHFGADQSVEIQNLIEQTDFEDGAELGLLFDFAVHFDDGHGLKAMQIEGCWHCDKPHLFEFGGDTEFRGRLYNQYTSSQLARGLASAVGTALEIDDVETASDLLTAHVNELLAGVKSAGTRDALRVKISEGLNLVAA